MSESSEFKNEVPELSALHGDEDVNPDELVGDMPVTPEHDLDINSFEEEPEE